jgi:hypothetical protein
MADDGRVAVTVNPDGSYAGSQRNANRPTGDHYVPGTDGDVAGWSRTSEPVPDGQPPARWKHTPRLSEG